MATKICPDRNQKAYQQHLLYLNPHLNLRYDLKQRHLNLLHDLQLYTCTCSKNSKTEPTSISKDNEFEKSKMAKNGPLAGNNWYEWNDWLINHILESDSCFICLDSGSNNITVKTTDSLKGKSTRKKNFFLINSHIMDCIHESDYHSMNHSKVQTIYRRYEKLS